MKKLLFIFAVITLTACQKTEVVTNKTTCLQAQQAIENAKYQMNVIDTQIMLASDKTAITVAKARKSELEAASKLFERIIEDPALNCPQYFK